MVLKPFDVPIDTRLIRYSNEIFKFKVIMKDVDSLPESYNTEIEMVLRRFIHKSNRNTLKKVQTKNLLIDISTKQWKAARSLKFTLNQKELKSYTKEVHLNVQNKKSEETVTGSRGMLQDNQTKSHGQQLRNRQPVVRLKRLESTETSSTSAGPSTERHQLPVASTSHKDVDQGRKRHMCNLSDNEIQDKVPRLDQSTNSVTVNLGTPVDYLLNQKGESDNSFNRNNNNSVDATEIENHRDNSEKRKHYVHSKRFDASGHGSTGSRRNRVLYPFSKNSANHVKTVDSNTRNVLAYTRDRMVIHQENLEEEMKLQQMSTIQSNRSMQKPLNKTQPPSLLAAAMSVLISPMKLLFSRKSK